MLPLLSLSLIPNTPSYFIVVQSSFSYSPQVSFFFLLANYHLPNYLLTTLFQCSSFLFVSLKYKRNTTHQSSSSSTSNSKRNSSLSLIMAPASFVTESKTVCVMDASGQLGSNLVERLLQRGYTVHAAVQNKNGDLKAFGGLCCDNKKLKVFHSDPLDYHSILDALKGCSGLFYSFEPPSDHPVYDEFMADVEVRAAHNVLEACAQTDTIQKVVFTSSVTAVVWSDGRYSTPSDLDERNWSDVNLCKKFKLWHALSKTLAEKTAWALAMDRGLNMVSINGGLLMSPNLTINNPYLKGAAEMYEDGVFVTVDVRFVVDAHICVFEDVSSYGRYICFNNVINRNDQAVKIAHMLVPPSPTSPLQSIEDTRIYQQRISNKKLNKLLVNFDGEQRVD